MELEDDEVEEDEEDDGFEETTQDNSDAREEKQYNLMLWDLYEQEETWLETDF